MRGSRTWPWVVAAIAVALAVAAMVVDEMAASHGEPWWLTTIFVALALGMLAIGLLVSLRVPGHPIGPLLLANTVILALSGTLQAYARYGLLEQPGTAGADWVAVLDSASFPLLFAPVTAIVLLFPDGRLPSPRWRPIAIGAPVSFTVVLATGLGRPLEGEYAGIDNPLGELPPALDALGMLGLLGMLVSLIAAAWAVRVRFRDATGIRRLQLKCLVYSACLVPLSLALGTAFDDDALHTLTIILIFTAIPGGVGLAVLRYRLYEIDRLINRTLVYGALTLLLAGGYAAIALGLGVAVGGSSAWTTAAATLAVAAAFRPLRSRVQRAVDRRFARARYDALRRIEAFLAELRAGQAAPEEVEGVLAQVLDDPDLRLHYWLVADAAYADSRGEPIGEAAAGERSRTEVTRAGVPVAVVVHDAALDERPDLLASVIEAAGLAIEMARLRVELRRQLDEVEASRARIVAAGYEERRRIERDLHDGAQQRLVTIGLTLRHLQHELAPGAGAADNMLDGAVAEIGRAIAELRELARGVRPGQLDDGIAPALRELAARTSLPVEVRATDERFPTGLEAAAYFIVCEGLTNAVKHANASRVVVSAARSNGRLVLSVADDGVGGAAAAGGSGLAGLADRVAAQGGTLTLDSPQGAGTTLTVELPCGS